MKVVIPLINLSWHGGIRVVVQLANHLAANGIDTRIFVARGYVTGKFAISPKVRLQHVGIHTGYKSIDYLVFLLVLPLVLPRASVVVANFFITYFSVVIGAWIKGGRHIYLVQDIESKYRGTIGSLLNHACRATYRDRHMITVNRYLSQRLRDEFGAASATVNIGPADIFYELPQTANKHKAYDVLFFARRETWKGLDRFLALLEQAPADWKVVCISQDKPLLEQLAAKACICVCPSDDAELIRLIDSSRILYFSSYDEGFGLPPLECMARGVPTVLHPCRGPDLYVSDGDNALYVDSPAEAREKIAHLLSDASFYDRLSQAGRRTADRFRLDAALATIGEFILARAPPVLRTGSDD